MPVTKFSALILVIKNFVNICPFSREMTAIASRGNAMPNPNKKKLTRLERNDDTVVLIPKTTTIGAGLHGIIINPNRMPYKKAPANLFLHLGSGRDGNLLGMEMPVIRKIEIIRRRIKAALEIIPAADESDSLRRNTKRNPTASIAVIIPAVIIIPSSNGFTLRPP